MCVHGAGVCSAGRMQSRNLGSLSGARGSSGVLPGEAEWQSGLMASPSWRDEALLISQPGLGALVRTGGWFCSFFSVFSTFNIRPVIGTLMV